MRPGVAIATTYFAPVVGGAESAAGQLARFLQRRGDRVLVVTRRTDPAHARMEDIDGVHVVRVGPIGPRRASGKWLAIPAFWRALVARRGEYRAIYVVDYRGIGLAALAAGRLGHVPVFFQAATDHVLDRSGLGRIARSLYRRADAFVCISHDIERETLTAGVPRNRVHYVPHPVDLARFVTPDPTARRRARATLGVPLEARVAIFVGRLSLEKGVMDLLSAWRRVDVPRAVLVLVGPDMRGHPWDRGAAARQWVHEQSLADRVRFAGAQSPAQVAHWLTAADLAVQPSHFEAFGISALEAMAAGLPVVASRVGGLRDFVEDGVNGRLVPPEDVEALAAALQTLLTDDAARRDLGARARETAARFDEPRVLGEVAALIDAGAAER